MSLYDVILADPPWQYTSKSVTPNREVTNHYPTMPTADICALPVSEFAAKRCALFMWATWPLMPDALQVIQAWGFTFKTIGFDWIKLNQNSMGVFVGMGAYTRSNPEPCLLAFRGDPLPVQAHDVPAVIMSPVREHSRKPAEIHAKIEKLYPNMRYLEMFARRPRKGWDVFGNEVTGSIRLPTPREPDKGDSPDLQALSTLGAGSALGDLS